VLKYGLATDYSNPKLVVTTKRGFGGAAPEKNTYPRYNSIEIAIEISIACEVHFKSRGKSDGRTTDW
jgi:hypothetical protein